MKRRGYSYTTEEINKRNARHEAYEQTNNEINVLLEDKSKEPGLEPQNLKYLIDRINHLQSQVLYLEKKLNEHLDPVRVQQKLKTSGRL